MKQFLLSVLSMCLFANSIFAQTTLQNTDFLLSTTGKDSAMSKLMKRTGAVLPTEGANQVWDFTNLRDSTPEPYYFGYITYPVTAARPAAFGSATLQADHFTSFQNFSIPTRSYYLLNSTGYGLMGDSISNAGFSLTAVTGSSGDSMKILAGVRAYSTPERQYRFPMTMSTAWSSSFRAVTNFSLKVALLGLNNAPGQYVANNTKTDTIVGWGTLKMRHPSTGATLSFNALLHRETIVQKDSFYLNGGPAPDLILGAFGVVQGQSTTRLVNMVHIAGFKAPALWIERTAGTTTMKSIFRAILPNLGLTLKNNELTDLEVATTVFPNPTTEGVTFEFDKRSAADWRVFMYNAAGQIVKNESVNAPIGTIQHTTRFENTLPNGTYFYQILDNNSLIRNTGKVVVNR